MEWIQNLLFEPTAVQAVIIICGICAIGLPLGHVRFKGISFGVAFVFFVGIAVGALGLRVDAQMLSYAESFGLVVFVYALGLQVGPGFMSAFRAGGAQLNVLGAGLILLGTLVALVTVWTGLLNVPEMLGVLCGATTNTPALGAAQQTLKQVGGDGATAALGCAVTYPLGMMGVIFALMLMRGFLQRHERPAQEDKSAEEAFIASFHVCNPAAYGLSLQQATMALAGHSVVVSRLWRGGKVQLPNSQTVLEEGDRVLVITTKPDLEALTIFFGRQEEENWNRGDLDWNSIDAHLLSERIVITRPEINGKRLVELHLRTLYGVSVSRVRRADLHLVATPNLRLRMGDRVTVVGSRESIAQVAEVLGNRVNQLDEPNMVTICLGIVLGLVLGSVPILVPGISIPVKLGLAGGPILMGILIGAYGPRLHMVAYVTSSANRMLRSLGLSMYLACLGLDAGQSFLATVVQPQALAWLGWSLVFCMVPCIVLGIVSVFLMRKSYATTAGMLCGAMANPIALSYVNDTLKNDKASVAYASVYPLAMFVRVILAQIMATF